MEEQVTQPQKPSSKVCITEIYLSQPGANHDWNLRGGVGANDSFIEISTPRPMSLAGYRIVVGDCRYTIAPDNWTYPLKVFWRDYMEFVSEGPYTNFPPAGVAELYDASGVLVDRREYSQPRVDESWAPADAFAPEGPWTSRLPSPGQRWSTEANKPHASGFQKVASEVGESRLTTPLVFLSYAREDTDHARRLCDDLEKAGVNVWFDKDSILPGEKWQPVIEKAIKASRFFIVLLSSRCVNKKGYVQKELKVALDVLDQYPEPEVYVIPVRIEDCEPSHSRLHELQWVDLFDDWRAGVGRIVKVIETKTSL